MQSIIRCIVLLLLTALLIGCTPSRTYEIKVYNQSADNLTLWLTKDGPPAEEGWLSPEQFAERTIAGDKPAYDLATVPPGKTAVTGARTGHFEKGTHAILRVYRGDYTIHDILLAPSARLVDYVLTPGMNDLIANIEGDKIIVKPAP